MSTANRYPPRLMIRHHVDRKGAGLASHDKFIAVMNPENERPDDCEYFRCGDLSAAMATLRDALNENDDYRFSWVANIACAVMDEDPNVFWETRQKIGRRFVEMLCTELPGEILEP